MRITVLAVIGAALTLSACGGEKEEKPPLVLPEPLTEAEKAQMVATLPSPYHEADLAAGATEFARCRSCHTITKEGANGTGPNLFGVFGRHVAAHPDYDYSDALEEEDFIWDAEKLDHWLTEPREFVPGNKMSFRGLRDEEDRINLIAFLMAETGYRTPAMLGEAPMPETAVESEEAADEAASE